MQALAITVKPMEYLCEAEAWGHTPHDMAAIAAYNLGRYQDAVIHARAAFEIATPEHRERLANNLVFCEQKA